MTEQDKQLLLVDLCGRLPYGVFVNIEGFDYDFNGKLVQVYFGNINRCSIQVGSNISYSLEETKPWLRPMSSMTEEEKEHVNDIIDEFANKWIDSDVAKDKWDATFWQCSEIVNYLNSIHIDYRGLIEKRLAISTEEFNPYEK